MNKLTPNLSPDAERINTLSQRHDALMARLNAATRAAGRTQAPLLLAVSKTQSALTIAAAIRAGLYAFGENYLQEALPKMEVLNQWFSAQPPPHSDKASPPRTISWHYIGNVQSNKTRAIAEHFDWVHTVSSDKQLQRLNEHRPPEKGPLHVCLQINIDAEPQKQGIRAQDAPALALAALRCENIVLRGLMCLPATNHMPAPSDQMPSRATRNAFEQLAELLDTLRNSLTDIPSHSSHFTPRRSPQTLDTLSMGMSADLPQAIAAGSTLVRVGTALFGPRLNTQNAKPHSMNPDDSAPPLDTGPDTH